MSLNDRLDFEEGYISSEELITKTCAQCKFWSNLIKRKYDYCHKCINNPKVKIKGFSGFSIEELFDYFTPMEKTKPVKKAQ
jgi:hypothetical protein